MGSSPLRRSDRGKRLVKIADLENIKSTKEKAANDLKQCSEDLDVGGRKRKSLTAVRYKALFKPQRRRAESDDKEGLEVEGKYQAALDKDLDQIEHVEKRIGGIVSPSHGNIANTAPEVVKPETEKDQHIPNENVSRNVEDAIENIKRERDEQRASLENEYKVDKAFIRVIYSKPSITRSNKLHLLEREFAKKLEEHEIFWQATLLAVEGQVAPSGDPKVAPTLLENPIEVQSLDEPVCEGATVSSEQIGEVPAQQLNDDMEGDVADKVDSSPIASHAVEDHNEAGGNVMVDATVVSSEQIGEVPAQQLGDDMEVDVAEKVDCGDVEMPAGTYNRENDETGTLNLDPSLVEDCHVTIDDVAVKVESAEMGTPAGKENSAGGEINPVCAAVPHGTTPSVEPLSSPASDHLDPIIPEIQNEPLQLQELPDSGFQDEETNVQQSGENVEVNHVPAAETHQEENEAQLVTSVAPATPVNTLNMFDNLVYQVSSQTPTNPLQAEEERLYTVKDNVTKFYQEWKQRLNSECKKELAEILDQIRLKYKAKHQEADAAFNLKKTELESNINRVTMNRMLAEAFISSCQDPTPPVHPASQAGLMQHLNMLSVSPSMRPLHGVPLSSSTQPSPPLPQLRPPLQVVHQPGALFSSRPRLHNTTSFGNR